MPTFDLLNWKNVQLKTSGRSERALYVELAYFVIKVSSFYVLQFETMKLVMTFFLFNLIMNAIWKEDFFQGVNGFGIQEVKTFCYF